MKNFQELIDYCQAHKIQFIGTGNPDAKVLIIGKECAIDEKLNQEQYKTEILQNVTQWKDLHNGKDVAHSPRYPYKGQLLKRLDKQKTNNGTSDTWCNYQRLKDAASNDIDFHNDFFITELSVITMANSKGKSFGPTKESIAQRLEMIKNSDYFQSFDIVILACGDYITEEQICNVFDVQIDGADLVPRQWHSWYRNKEKSKIVVHTRQLSGDVSNDLLDKIREKIKG